MTSMIRRRTCTSCDLYEKLTWSRTRWGARSVNNYKTNIGTPEKGTSKPMSHAFRCSAIALITCIYAAASTTALADWQVTPSVAAGLEYDDNAVLLDIPGADASTSGYAAQGDLLMTYRRPTSVFTIDPMVLARRYQESVFDSEDYFVNLDFRHSGERSTFRFRGLYGNESVRTAERANVDFNVDNPDDIPVDDSGRLLGTANRQRISLVPQWSYRVGERARVYLGGTLIDVTYDDEVSPFYSDYSQATGNTAFEFDVSQTNAVRLDAYYRANEFPDLDISRDAFGGALGLVRTVSERSRLAVNVGIDETEGSDGEKVGNSIGEISFTHQLQTSRVLASYRRSVTGSGAAQMTVRDSVNLSFTRPISDRFSLGAGISAYQSSGLDSNASTANDRDYLQLRALFTWRLTRTLLVDFDYRYSKLDRKDTNTSADSNRINLWLRYSGQQ